MHRLLCLIGLALLCTPTYTVAFQSEKGPRGSIGPEKFQHVLSTHQSRNMMRFGSELSNDMAVNGIMVEMSDSSSSEGSSVTYLHRRSGSAISDTYVRFKFTIQKRFCSTHFLTTNCII